MPFESEGECRDAPVGPIGESMCENGCTVLGVEEAFRGGPVGEVNPIFDAIGMKVAVGKGIEGVTGEFEFFEFAREPVECGRIRENLPNDGLSQPESRSDGGFDEGSYGEGKPFQPLQDVCRGETGVNVSTITQREGGEGHWVMIRERKSIGKKVNRSRVHTGQGGW